MEGEHPCHDRTGGTIISVASAQRAAPGKTLQTYLARNSVPVKESIYAEQSIIAQGHHHRHTFGLGSVNDSGGSKGKGVVYMHKVGTLLLDCLTCPAIGRLVPKRCRSFTPNGHAIQILVFKDQCMDIMTLLAKKNRLRSETLILAAGLLIVGVQDENFHRNTR